jgi:hypothetical protein
MKASARCACPNVAPPVGLARVTLKVSAPSFSASFEIGTVKVFDVAPAAHVSAPETEVKSAPSVAALLDVE